MPRRNARGQFVKGASRAAPRRSSSTALARSAPRTVVRRSSPYVVASKSRRASGTAYAPIKSAIAGAAIGVVETRFASTWAKLPELGGSRMPAAAAILHVARGKIPHGPRLAECAATIAGYEAGKSGKLLGLSGNGDDF